MSRFDDISVSKTTFEGQNGGEINSLKVNMVDVDREDFQAFGKILPHDDRPNMLPVCEIGDDPGIGKAAKLINAPERRGFDVEYDKENRTLEISKKIQLGDHGKMPGAPLKRVDVDIDFEPRHPGFTF